MSAALGLLERYLDAHNAGVNTGDWTALLDLFEDFAELRFEGRDLGPFRGRTAIASAFRDRPPTDELVLLRAYEDADAKATAVYAWARRPNSPEGNLLLEASGDAKIKTLTIS